MTKNHQMLMKDLYELPKEVLSLKLHYIEAAAYEEELHLVHRVMNSLMRAELKTFDDLIEFPVDKFPTIRTFGVISEDMLHELLQRISLNPELVLKPNEAIIERMKFWTPDNKLIGDIWKLPCEFVFTIASVAEFKKLRRDIIAATQGLGSISIGDLANLHMERLKELGKEASNSIDVMLGRIETDPERFKEINKTEIIKGKMRDRGFIQ